jgi:hypothetical protein
MVLGAVLRFFGLRGGSDDGGGGDAPNPLPPRSPAGAAHKRSRSAARRPPPAHQPVLQDAADGSGGVQGLAWVAAAEVADADGDSAAGFIDADAAGGPVALLPTPAAAGTAAAALAGVCRGRGGGGGRAGGRAAGGGGGGGAAGHREGKKGRGRCGGAG